MHHGTCLSRQGHSTDLSRLGASSKFNFVLLNCQDKPISVFLATSLSRQGSCTFWSQTAGFFEKGKHASKCYPLHSSEQRGHRTGAEQHTYMERETELCFCDILYLRSTSMILDFLTPSHHLERGGHCHYFEKRGHIHDPKQDGTVAALLHFATSQSIPFVRCSKNRHTLRINVRCLGLLTVSDAGSCLTQQW